MQNPLETFLVWHRDAVAAGEADPDAMTLATTTLEGRPSARVVLFRGTDERGVRFFTNYRSRKGRELEANPHAALLFYWPLLRRQVRIEGLAERVEPTASDVYFAARPRGHQLGAWASAQSESIATLEDLDAGYVAIEREYDGRDVPRPPHWGGFRVVPERIELWQARDNRMHERIVFERHSGLWKPTRLSP